MLITWTIIPNELLVTLTYVREMMHVFWHCRSFSVSSFSDGVEAKSFEICMMIFAKLFTVRQVSGTFIKIQDHSDNGTIKLKITFCGQVPVLSCLNLIACVGFRLTVIVTLCVDIML